MDVSLSSLGDKRNSTWKIDHPKRLTFNCFGFYLSNLKKLGIVSCINSYIMRITSNVKKVELADYIEEPINSTLYIQIQVESH